MAETANTDHDALGRFTRGNCASPGRPKGGKQKLDALATLYAVEDWEVNGRAFLAKLRETEPAAYAKFISAMCPKEVKHQVADEVLEAADYLGKLRLLSKLLNTRPPALLELEPENVEPAPIDIFAPRK
jgi:hypothetical protein